ncbi:hypothetical protein VTJ49DRAFT_4663 [Mycothermus thermophilus]|uniref:Uncharacterized protein n=1 Tax=Humicola insolens TaxID=85995 RepID=A0ABR3VLH0_HUMIN
MGGSQPPYLYQPVKRDEDRFPETPFDPKAVTRASYEAKKPKPKPQAPFVSINRHPDMHDVLPGRKGFKPMSRRTKGWIRGMRVVQLCLRVPQVIAAAGLIVVMIVAGLMSGLFAWVMSTTLGVAIIHCCYSIYHHSRPAGLKPAGSSAAYHFFSAVSDLLIPPLYAYGAYTTRHRWDEWKANPEIAETVKVKYVMPSLHYGLVAAGGLHLASLGIALWLGFMFRRISKMPPDMNPLESNLTSRVTVHKRNKSSVVISITAYSDGKRDSQQLYDDADSPRRSVPFMHTRQGSESTVAINDSRINLPSRQYQITPGNSVPASPQKSKRMSAPPSTSHSRCSYTEIPLSETATNSSSAVTAWPPSSTPNLPRPARFTETWYASDSLISRTQQRNRKNNLAARNNDTPRRAAYTTLDASSDSDNDSDSEPYYTPAPAGPVRGSSLCTGSISNGSDTENHTPHPLRSHPSNYGLAAMTPPTTTDDDDEASNTENNNPSHTNDKKKSTPRRPRTPFSHLRTSRILADVSVNDRDHPALNTNTDDEQEPREQEQDITDMKDDDTLRFPKKRTSLFPPRMRLSSIQPDADFYSKPYRELKPATPPIMIGPDGKEMTRKSTAGGMRQVSSGCDFGDLGAGEMGRRRVSARAAEEGRGYGY